MKKLIMFLAGIVLIALMGGMIVVGATVYDTASKQTIDTFFFQPAPLSSQRVGVPASISDLSDDKIREMLTDKFITEYFYVIPDMNNINVRLAGGSGLKTMVAPELFKQWVDTTGAQISKMAADGMMRTARLVEMELPEIGDTWRVTYELLTWSAPNDLSMLPTVTRGTMFVNLRYEPGFWKDSATGKEMDIGKHLEAGKDPSSIFKFRVYEIENIE